jgi:hypothetical protein
MAREVVVGRATDLVAMIRQTESRGLIAMIEIDDSISAAPEEVVSRPFRLDFPVDARGILQPGRLLLRVNAPDFTPGQDEKQILLSPDGDSEPVIFLLTPNKAGLLAVTVELYQEAILLVSRLLRTNGKATAQELMSSAKSLVTIPLQVLSDQYEPMTGGSSLATLRLLLDRHFSMEDLRNLSFDLGIDPDSFTATSKSGFSRELIIHLAQRNRLWALEHWIDRNRPDLSFPKLPLPSASLPSQTSPPAPGPLVASAPIPPAMSPSRQKSSRAWGCLALFAILLILFIIYFFYLR